MIGRRWTRRGSRSLVVALPGLALAAAVTAALVGPGRAAAAEGQVTWAVHISLAPTWFDPAETPGIITPFMVLYALHDGLVKPMPGKPMAPSLKFSFERYRGASAALLRANHAYSAPYEDVRLGRP